MRIEPKLNRISFQSINSFESSILNHARQTKVSPGAVLEEIPLELKKRAIAIADAAMVGRHPIDPLLGEALSRLVSAASSAVKRSGNLIEHAVAAALEAKGLLVCRQLCMQVSSAARSIVSLNSFDAVNQIALRTNVLSNEPTVVFDMAVYDPKQKIVYRVEVKRGNGPTEIRKIKPIGETLRAGALQLKSNLMSAGTDVKKVIPIVIDFFGHSGFDDSLAVTGDRINSLFRANVTNFVDEVLNLVRVRLETDMPSLVARAFYSIDYRDAEKVVTLDNGLKVDVRFAEAIDSASCQTGYYSKGNTPRRAGVVVTTAETAAMSSAVLTIPKFETQG